MKSRTDETIDRIFGRVDKILTAIEAGENPQPAIDAMAAAQPWDVVALGQDFVRDAIQSERQADDGN